MGQYYTPVFMDKQGEICTLYAHDFDNGLKLMEHSYVGNDFVNAALSILWNKRCSVAWVGDYADDPYVGLYAEKLEATEFKRIYDRAWDEKDSWKVPASCFEQRQLSSACTMHTKKKFLVNHTRREYIHMGEYIAENKYAETGAWVKGKYDIHATSEWCIHPLPLLTACGNGRGGGDFHEGGLGYELVGLWAFDVIEYKATVPKGYAPVMFSFMEARHYQPFAVGSEM